MAAWIAAHGTPAPPGADCDASIVPVVTAGINEEVLDRLADGLLTGRGLFGESECPRAEAEAPGRGLFRPGQVTSMDVADTLALARRAARQVIVAQAVRLLSGPTGLAAWLRTRQLSGLAGSVSLPLDLGIPTETIPPHIRRAVARRDRHCRFPGCQRPPAACHVHHLRPKSDGGPTSVANCALLCPFHHLVAIHRWGWTLTLHPDGTTTATSPDGQRTLHSHAPPTAA
jgi:hypothetical protein